MPDAIRRSLATFALAAAVAGCGGTEATPDAQPVVALDAPSLQFSAEAGGAVPSAQRITVMNGGGGTLAAPTASVSYVEGAGGWLDATVAGFEVTVAVTNEALAQGHYAGIVTVASTGSSNGSVTIPVTLDVFRPELALSHASLSLAATTGAIPAPITFAVSNAGEGALAVPTATASTLLTAQVAGDKAPYTVSVTLREPIVMPSNWSGTVTVDASNAANGPLTIPVTIVVRLPPPPPDAVTAACYRSALSTCVEVTSDSAAELATFQQSCDSGAVFLNTPCPSERKYAGCGEIGSSTSRYTYWYYSPAFCPLNLTMCVEGIWIDP